MINEHSDPEVVDCECCLGDPELVCAACGDHACWAGYFFCNEYRTADVVTRAEFAAKEGAS